MTDVRALRAVGDSLRADRTRRRWLHRRTVALVIVSGLLIATIGVNVRPRLIWNASASMPIGLYAVTRPDAIDAGETIVARLPPVWRSFADVRHYLPPTVPLIKTVAAAPGDTVCAAGARILVNGRRRADRRRADRLGRWLPWWQGCITLHDGAVFLLAPSPLSFDGRYVGPTERTDIIGRARPLWTR